MRFRLFLSPQAKKDLKRLERSIFGRINRALLLLLKNPYPVGIKNLQGSKLAQFRIRISDYRVLYDVYPKKMLFTFSALATVRIFINEFQPLNSRAILFRF